ncbi:cell division protein FtsN [Rossellomorea vietnamensis]|uniref:Cell division protein FtsN n=1 Tax=Rossellomorea vietnamensis TaxID=218284 RepID=A0A5D4NWK2_9BACI|nr:CalY family protein [Rossellomorea vietnamensis]TYS17864.1 cell division protein FtsN [Rossellomorea vietnamensis]
MGIKQKLGLGIASAALGLSLVGGGTYAYFSDTETSTNTFAAGTLDIKVKGNDAANAIIDVSNIKPGDTMQRNFKLNNTGSLDVSKVILTTDYTVGDTNGNNGTDDLGDHIKVQFLINKDKKTEVVHETTLSALRNKDVVDRDVLGWLLDGEKDGLKANTSDDFIVKFEFVDNKQDQNKFQGDSLKLDWTFNAKQTAGERR